MYSHMLTVRELHTDFLLVLTSQCLDKTIGISTLEQAIEDIKASITKAGGDCQVKMAPRAVTENDDAELAALMEKRERENQQVSGDEDESSSDEGEVGAAAAAATEA